jgi:integrase
VSSLSKVSAGIPVSAANTSAASAAVRHGLLARNPTDFADKLKVPQKDVTETVRTPEQIMAFLEQTKRDRLAPLWQTACMTGLRRSELCGLQWPDIDLDAGVLSVKRARVQIDGAYGPAGTTLKKRFPR